MEVASIVNKAYIKNIYKNTTVITGINYYPFKFNLDKIKEKFFAIEINCALPFTLCLTMPIFMYTLVLEKETRLIDTMKINGMLLYNYWIVNFVFCYLYQMFISLNLLIWAKYIFQIPMFIHTNTTLFVLIFNGWALS